MSWLKNNTNVAHEYGDRPLSISLRAPGDWHHTWWSPANTEIAYARIAQWLADDRQNTVHSLSDEDCPHGVVLTDANAGIA